MFARKENNERRAYEVELPKANRQADYIRRVHYMPEYAKELRTTNISDVLFGRFITATQNGIKVIQKHGLKCAIYRLFVDAVCTRMGYYLVILFAAFRILVLRNMMVGDGLMVVMAMFSVTEALLDQENSFFQLHKHAMYIGDLKDFLDYEPQIREDGTEAAVPVPVEELRVQNLSFSYFGGHRKVIDDISFTVKGGQTVAIVGHNGAGKSTLVKLLMRLYEPTSGKIYLNGRKISEYKLSAYRNSFSTVKAGIAENFCDVSVPLLREYDKDGRLVSGGEAQKIAIARVFLKDPHTYILDEPSSALDPISEYNLNQTLFELSKDRTVIFISHRLSTTRMAEQIYMMEQGRIIEEGNHEELLARGGRYAEMFEKQAEKYQEK